MNENIEQTQELRNGSNKDSNLKHTNTGEKKMEKMTKATSVNFVEINDLLEEEIVPNKNLIDQYNRKKEEAKKLKTKLLRVAEEVKVLGDKIKNTGGMA
ncbi:hypothetical protein BKH42_08155 [Helicobacter sp. 13S00482-2]|uniref:hypothetical protein n=1 Tax=Helicobacter sp. 13S00482-2 TaxID=1476200 RepID=UPI000BA7C2BE|nr:hypothetical protein [Helicobacter sp. 13S00482-2]PAF53017.1 hypothetical protein BKH42_08155 [Helicobacter sp. 13S00482-2]